MTDSKTGYTKAQQREMTTARLVEIAREVFTRDGYAGAAMEEIVHRAGVTRGALYHHFGSKEGLFLAVVNSVQAEVGQRVLAAAQSTPDRWDSLVAGCVAFLEASLDPQVQRIMLIDAPSVLGWSRWREFDAEYSMASLTDALQELIALGQVVSLPLDALVHLLSGAMNEAALWIAQSPQPTDALKDAVQSLRRLLEGLRTN
jgi:AcrR family transcriptional regulator